MIKAETSPSIIGSSAEKTPEVTMPELFLKTKKENIRLICLLLNISDIKNQIGVEEMINAYKSFGASLEQMQKAEELRSKNIKTLCMEHYEELAQSANSNF